MLHEQSLYWFLEQNIPLLTEQTTWRKCLTFVGPCIVIYLYSKTNQMHNISNLFYFGTTLYMFRTVLWLPASKQPQNLYAMMLYVQS